MMRNLAVAVIFYPVLGQFETHRIDKFIELFWANIRILLRFEIAMKIYICFKHVQPPAIPLKSEYYIVALRIGRYLSR